MQWETAITDGTKRREEGGGKSISTYAELALIFLSERNVVWFFSHFSCTSFFCLHVHFPFKAQRKRPSQKKAEKVGLGGVKTRLFSLSAAHGNRKGTRSDFKAAVLAAIPELTLLDLGSRMHAVPFLRWSAVPVLFPFQPSLPSFLTGIVALHYLLSLHAREPGCFRSPCRSQQDVILLFSFFFFFFNESSFTAME